MEIILVRHGLTKANKEKIFSTEDTRLDESSYELLEKTKEKLNGFQIDRIYTSNLLRAKQTAKILGFENFTIDSRLNEMDFGDFKGKSYDYVFNTYDNFFKNQKEDIFHIKYPNGENRIELINRLSEFYDELVEKNENALCISHGIAIKASLFWILKDFSAWDNFWIENGSITVFQIKDNKKLIKALNILWNLFI